MNTNDIHEIELNIDAAKAVIEMADALERLYTNPDFQKVILEEYMENSSIRLVKLKAEQGAQNVDIQANIMRKIDAIGSLDQFFKNMNATAETAIRSLKADMETHEELLEEVA